MKKLLFVAASMQIGGAEVSLVNLLELIDYSKYEVSLLLLQEKGELLERIPAQVRRLKKDSALAALYEHSPTGSAARRTGLRLTRLMATAVQCLCRRSYDAARAHRWRRHYCRRVPMQEGCWDTAVAWQGGDTLYYVADKVNARRKAAVFHTDPVRAALAVDIERDYVSRIDLLAAVSEKCALSLREIFPEHPEKIICLHNLTSPHLVRRRAAEFVPEEINNPGAVIVTVGRLVKVKGVDMAAQAARLLLDRGHDICWYVVGEGPERKALTDLIGRLGLKDRFFLLGAKNNPCPFMLAADVIVQPSRYEGRSVVLDEAKALAKPIVVTDYPSAGDQITDGVNGVTAPMNPEGIADAVERLLNDKALSECITGALSAAQTDISQEAERYCRILTGEQVEASNRI